MKKINNSLRIITILAISLVVLSGCFLPLHNQHSGPGRAPDNEPGRRDNRRHQQQDNTVPSGINSSRQNSSTYRGTGTSNTDVSSPNEEQQMQDSKTEKKSRKEERRNRRR